MRPQCNVHTAISAAPSLNLPSTPTLRDQAQTQTWAPTSTWLYLPRSPWNITKLGFLAAAGTGRLTNILPSYLLINSPTSPLTFGTGNPNQTRIGEELNFPSSRTIMPKLPIFMLELSVTLIPSRIMMESVDKIQDSFQTPLSSKITKILSSFTWDNITGTS